MQQPPMTDEQFIYHWESLKSAVQTLLVLKPGKYPPVSYEQTYRFLLVIFGY